MAWYYGVITNSVIASPEGVWLVLSIPLKDVLAQYEMVKAYTFPTEVLNSAYVEIYLEKPYLTINLAKNTRLDVSEADLTNCNKYEQFMICPADKTVMNREFKSSFLSLCLKAEDAPRICERRLHTVPPEPFLLRYGTDIVFYTPEPCRAFFRCKLENRWQTTTRSLHGSGLIKGAAACHVATDRYYGWSHVLTAPTNYFKLQTSSC
jgi:hypothetical protein